VFAASASASVSGSTSGARRGVMALASSLATDTSASTTAAAVGSDRSRIIVLRAGGAVERSVAPGPLPRSADVGRSA
jgi:hypothetical protein